MAGYICKENGSFLYMSALTCIGIDLFLYMSFCSFAFVFTFGDEHGQIDNVFRLTTTTEGDHKGRPYGAIMDNLFWVWHVLLRNHFP